MSRNTRLLRVGVVEESAGKAPTLCFTGVHNLSWNSWIAFARPLPMNYILINFGILWTSISNMTNWRLAVSLRVDAFAPSWLEAGVA